MFRFTIRELVLLTLVAAMGVGRWVDYHRQRVIQNSLRKAAIFAETEANWKFSKLRQMIESQGYGVKNGPGKSVTLRTPQGWSVTMSVESESNSDTAP